MTFATATPVERISNLGVILGNAIEGFQAAANNQPLSEAHQGAIIKLHGLVEMVRVINMLHGYDWGAADDLPDMSLPTDLQAAHRLSDEEAFHVQRLGQACHWHAVDLEHHIPGRFPLTTLRQYCTLAIEPRAELRRSIFGQIVDLLTIIRDDIASQSGQLLQAAQRAATPAAIP